jgi:hypothetical protein
MKIRRDSGGNDFFDETPSRSDFHDRAVWDSLEAACELSVVLEVQRAKEGFLLDYIVMYANELR